MVEDSDVKKIENMALVVRASIVLGMSAAVVTLLYLAPAPDQNFKSCDRPCHNLDWPMICRVKMHIESLPANVICQSCQNNSTNCWYPFCEDPHSQKSFILANRQLPAPPIQVCENDIIVVDVINNIPGHEITMHWRGQPNNEAPFMDGVPMITQCPISSYSSFQYKFRASSVGTHFFHAYSDKDLSKGLFGALVVRKSDELDPHKKLYDFDMKEHVMIISEWNGEKILVDGKGPDKETVKIVTVKKGLRYRFRLAYTSGECPITVSIDKHLFKVIALDGQAVNANEASHAKLAKGERLDFVLKANQDNDYYDLKIESVCNNKILKGLAVIKYFGIKSSDKKLNNKLKLLESEKSLRLLDTSFCGGQLGKICLDQIKSLEKIPKRLQDETVDRKLYLGYDYKYDENVWSGGVMKNLRFKTYRMDNISFIYPSSPLLTQPDDTNHDIMCNELHLPKDCQEKHICECVHIQHLPLGSTTEIILFDQGSDQDEHVFHLHGHKFYVVGYKIYDKPQTKQEIIKMDAEHVLLERNLATPVLKDTVRVPKNGVVAIRFVADNPGFWMLRDELSNGWTRGLEVVLQVGGLANVASIPTGFPTCSSFTGPDFFLM